MSVLTVTGLNNYISFKIKGDIKLKTIMVEGEISNFICHYKSGHLYFTLKDGTSTIKVVMFSSSAQRLKFTPKDGMKVVVSGGIDVYLRDGVYQINANDMYPSGIGELYLKYESLKNKLFDEGLFDEIYKKQIPQFPEKIGIVTSSSAAALADMLNILERRYNIAKVTIYPALVQGEMSAQSLSKSLYTADNDNNDVIVVTRGGGSFEDLFSFSSEELARTIFECKTPVVSAVGHETDFTIADFVADLRAPTPSAAAEIITPNLSDINLYLSQYGQKLNNIMTSQFDKYKLKIDNLYDNVVSFSPENKIINSSKQLEDLTVKLSNNIEKILKSKDEYLCDKITLLNSLSPLNVLSRGYSITYKDGKIIDDAKLLSKGDSIKIKFKNSEIDAQI